MSIYEELNVVENKVKTLYNQYATSSVRDILEHIGYLRKAIMDYQANQNATQVPVEVVLKSDEKKEQFLIQYPVGDTLYSRIDESLKLISNHEIAVEILKALDEGRSVTISKVPGWKILQRRGNEFVEILDTSKNSTGDEE